MKSLVEFRCEAALDFHRPQFPARQFEHQIDFGAGSRSIEPRPHALRYRAKEVFQHKTLPASTRDRMAQHRIPVVKAAERVNDAAVAHVDLRGFHQMLADIGVERRQAATEQEIDKKIEIAGDSFRRRQGCARTGLR